MDEIWKPVTLNPIWASLYEVSNLGRVRRIGGQPLTGGSCNGYRYVLLCNGTLVRKNVQVHRLVAGAFIPPIDGKPHIDHINAVRDDNRAENLRWCSPQENSNFSRSTHLKNICRGENSGKAKLTEAQVHSIFQLWPTYNLSQIGKETGVSHMSIRNVLIGKTWSHCLSDLEKSKVQSFINSRRLSRLSAWQKSL